MQLKGLSDSEVPSKRDLYIVIVWLEFLKKCSALTVQNMFWSALGAERAEFLSNFEFGDTIN
jgi:hypothetical protein